MPAYFNVNNTFSIEVRFECPYCQQEVQSGTIELHGANYTAKNDLKSYVSEDYDATCDNCEEEYYFMVFVGKDMGYIEFDESEEIKNIRIDIVSKEDYNEYHNEQLEAISDNKHLVLTFNSSLNSLTELNKIKLQSDELSSVLKRQIYTGIITSMETFLLDTMINLTLNDRILIRNFAESYPEFTNRKFSLKEIFLEYNKINQTIKNVLLDVIYHDLRKVREMYRKTFRIKFPDIAEINKCILIRHDIVHRNGKTKDGDSHNIDTEQVLNAIQTVKVFVTEIAEQLELT